jgi:hypothetical protein
MIEYNKEYEFDVIGYFNKYDSIYYRSTCGRFGISKISNKVSDNTTVIQRFIGDFIPRNFGFRLVKKYIL